MIALDSTWPDAKPSLSASTIPIGRWRTVEGNACGGNQMHTHVNPTLRHAQQVAAVAENIKSGAMHNPEISVRDAPYTHDLFASTEIKP